MASDKLEGKTQSNKVAIKVNVDVKPVLLSIWAPSPPGPYI
jgi:hypothetical protein